MPIERFKDSYKNWRFLPFGSVDMAVDKEEDGLVIPSGSPFVVQLLEVPRLNDPTSVSVRAYGIKTTVDQNSSSGQPVLYVASTTGFSATDKIVINRGGDREEDGQIDSVQAGVSLTLSDNLTYTHTAAQADDVEKYIEFAEVDTAPTQSQYRVDYPPDDGEGTGLIEFNQNDASKEIRVNYKATGSPALEEFLDTKVSYPAGDPTDHQILGFVSGAPDWRNNPIRYFHEGPVIYNAAGEDESCLLFRFKRTANEGKIYLELKGAKLHQGYYSELLQHNHGVGTLTIPFAPNHTHAAGSLAGSQPDHTHPLTGSTANQSVSHNHVISNISHQHAIPATGSGGQTGWANGCTSPSGNQSASHNHAKGTLAVGNGGNDAVTITGNTGSNGYHEHVISGNTANAGVAAKTYPDQLKVYINGVDKTAEVLALTGLTQFGDGTVGHAFVSTGSGEMDISSLVSAAQFHEIKITEPTSGKGGGCLLHLELY